MTRISVWIGHRAWLGVAAMPLLLLPYPWGLAAFVIVMLAVIAVVVIHVRTLCPECITDVADNPQALVDRRRLRLRVFHDRRLFYGLGLSVVAFALVGFAVERTFHVDLPPWLLLPPVIGGLAYLTSVQVTHRRLEPWCPFCRDEGGGDDLEHDQVPEPMPVGEKELA